MTRKNIIAKTTEFQQLLGLYHYKVTVDFKRTQDEIEGSAEVETARDYRHAKISYASDTCGKWTEQETDEVIVHELMHVLLQPMEVIGLQTAEEALPKSAANVVKTWMRRENEAAVELLTEAFLTALSA